MRDHVIQKRAVVAHQQQRAGVALQRVFQQLQRFDVEVVGGFVQHQQVGGLCKQACQQQAIAFAAGEHFHRRGGALRREQKIVEVAHHVLAARGRLNPLRAGADGFDQRALGIELLAHLVEVGDLQIGAQAHRARIGFERAEDEFDQRGFARAIGADETEAVAAHDAQIELVDYGVVAEFLCDVFKFRHQLAGALTGIQRQLHLAQALAARGAFIAQRFQPPHAAFVAGAAGLNTFADPHFFLRPEFVELAVHHFFGGKLIGFARFVRGEVAGVGAQQAAIQFDNTRGHAIQKRAIVGDDDGRLDRARNQQVFEQRNAGNVEMVGRLVEQQQVRLACHGQRQHRTFALAARGGGRRAVFIQTEAMQKLSQTRFASPALTVVVQGIEIRREREAFAQGGRLRWRGFLFDRGKVQAVVTAQHAAIQLKLAGNNFQQRRFAGAIAANEADALIRLYGEVGAVE